MDTLNRLKRFADGGKIRKYQDGDLIQGTELTDLEEEKLAKIEARRQKAAAREAKFMEGFGGDSMTNTGDSIADAASNFSNGNWKAGLTQAAVGASKALDNALMGDKNFGA